MTTTPHPVGQNRPRKERDEDLSSSPPRSRNSRGGEYAVRLAAMPPDQAADEIFDMFALCVDADLAFNISLDLQIHPAAAERIAQAIVRKRVGKAARG